MRPGRPEVSGAANEVRGVCGACPGPAPGCAPCLRAINPSTDPQPRRTRALPSLPGTCHCPAPACARARARRSSAPSAPLPALNLPNFSQLETPLGGK